MTKGLGTAPSMIGTQAATRLGAMRRRLLATTALQAAAVILLAGPAAAQLAPTARPQGGTVVAGQAGISQTSTQTTIAQTSQRAAIDWRSYNIGSSQTVTYQQPSASSITLNRVTGPDPSQIAGKIQANGQVVLVNQSGVVFQAGSQVDVQSLVVSTADVTNQNFMAGKMVFDQPGHPDAQISNAGTITVASTGLAALVAPQVANSGVITAKMGHVVLAGAEAHTVDLYGDGLMSVDVTREVTKAPNGATALVTNTGTINADGGTILLTAKAADGIIQNLVSAKGTLQANTLGGKTGTIVVSATGGSITIEGAVQAAGKAPGTTGGTVVLAATDGVGIGAKARVVASGQAGGGTIAIGTTAARARSQGGGVPAGSARTVTVAAGAKIAANAIAAGNGGSVALLSTGTTSMAGAITARGGKSGGNGGQVEVSGGSLGITGTVKTGAPSGSTGTLLLDPTTLTVTDAGTSSTSTDQVITSSAFNSLLSSNNVTLSATDTITLGGSTALQPSGGTNSLSLTATNATSTVNVNVALSTNGPITLAAGGAITLAAPVSAGTSTLTLNADSVGQTAAGTITAGTLTGTISGSLTLPSASNTVTSLGPIAAGTSGTGSLALTTSGGLTVAGAVSAPTAIALKAGGGAITVNATITSSAVDLQATTGISQSTASAAAITAGTLTGQVSDGTSTASSGHDVVLNNASNQIGTLGQFVVGTLTDPNVNRPVLAAQGNFALTDAAALTVNGSVLAAGVTMSAPSLTVNGFIGAVSGGVALTATTGAIAAPFGAVGSPTSVQLSAPGGVTVSGALIDAPTVTIGTGLNVSGGAVYGNTVDVTGPVVMTAGLLHANTLSLPGGLTFTGGDIYAGNDLSFSLGTAPPQLALIQTGGNLTITSGTGLNSGAGLVAGGNITINITSSFDQVGGAIIAGGNITLTSTGGAISQAASGVLLASGTLRVNGLGATGQTASILGTTMAGQVQLVEPGAALTVAPATLIGSPTTPASVTLTNVYFVPGQTTASPSSIVGLAINGGAGRPTTIRADAGSLVLGTITADTIELHSTGDTSETGSLTANTLLGTAGYALASLDTTGLPTYSTVLTAGVGSSTLSSTQNQVAALGPYYTGGNLSLQSATGLSVTDTLIAGPAQSIALTAPSIQVAATGSLRFGTASAGAFATNTRPVTTNAAVFTPSASTASATSYSSVSLSADRLEIDGTGTRIDAPGGIVAIAPYTPGLAMSVDASRSAASLSLPLADLSLINTLGTTATVGTGGPSTIRLGSLDGTTVTAGTLSINAPLTLTNQASILGLYATGTVSESSSGGITVGRPASASAQAVTGAITGSAGGDFLLGALSDTAPANHADQLLAIKAGGKLTVSEASDSNAGLLGLTVAGNLTAAGNIGLLVNAGSGSAGALTISAPVASSGGNATLIASGNLTGGSVQGATVSLYAGGNAAIGGISATTLTGSAGGSFSASGTFANAVSTMAGNGALALTDTSALALAGQSGSDGGNTSVDAASIAANGTLTASGTIQLHANGASGSFNQLGGTIAATGTVTIAGSSDTTPMGGSISQQAGTIASGSNVRLLAAGDAIQSSGATLAAPAIQVVSTGGTNSFAASKTANVGISETSGTIPGGPSNLLLPSVAGTATLSATQPTSVRLDGATLTLPGTVAATTVELHATGSMAENGAGVIQATTLTGTAGYAANGLDGSTGLPTYTNFSGNPGGSATLNNALNNVQRLGNFQARSGFTFWDTPTTGGLVIAGLVRSGLGSDAATSGAATSSGAPLSISLAGPKTTLTIGDTTSPGGALVGNEVTLNSTGGLSEGLQGLVAAGTLSGSAATVNLAPTSGNQIAQLGTFTSTGDVTLLNAPGLTITGAVNAGSATVKLTSPGNTISETGGSISAGTLTLNAGQVTAQSTANAVSTLSATTTAGGLAFTDSTPLVTTGIAATGGGVALSSASNLTLQGTTSASSSINLAAGTTLTLAGTETTPTLVAKAPAILLQGGTLTVGGVVQAPGTAASALPGAGTTPFTVGAQFEAGSNFAQTGITTVSTLSGFTQNTVRIDLTSGTGGVSFATLNAPATNLGLGLKSGTATGSALTVNNLGITYTGSGSVNLTGTVFNQGGAGAATASTISPNKSASYGINNCAIGSVNCVVLRPQAVPVSNPLKELNLSFFREQDDTLVVPNVTEQGL